jgi:hypothetical protein
MIVLLETFSRVYTSDFSYRQSGLHYSINDGEATKINELYRKKHEYTNQKM